MAARRDRPLAAQAWLRAPASRRVLAALGADGHAARFVGGCVRDGLLGLPDVGRELDVATPERPDQVIRLLERAGLPAIPTGLAHGTVTTIADDRPFEITTLRRDVACDGRHAEVEFTDDFALDAARRDFTINAMSCDAAGRLYDYFGGRADLAAGPGAFRRRGGGAHRRGLSARPALLPLLRLLRPAARRRRGARRLPRGRSRTATPFGRTDPGRDDEAARGGGARAGAAPDGRDRRARRGDPGAGRARAPGPADRAGARERSSAPVGRFASSAARGSRSRGEGGRPMAHGQSRCCEAARHDPGAAAGPECHAKRARARSAPPRRRALCGPHPHCSGR